MGKVVLAISGSHRTKSFTEKMLNLTLEGMGTDIEIHKFYPHKMHIKSCTGCLSCWKKKHGKCVIKDDFNAIMDIYMKADYLLIAAPLYCFGFPATVKKVIDRFFVLLEPEQKASVNGGTEHPVSGGRTPKTVLISSCGFPEIENFDLLRLLFRKQCQHLKWKHSGEILVPGAGAANAPKLFANKFEKIKSAGIELISKGNISKETTAAVAAPVMSHEEYRRMCSAAFKGKFGKVKAAYISVKALFKLRSKEKREKQLYLQK